jgi:hypothetical protein
VANWSAGKDFLEEATDGMDEAGLRRRIAGRSERRQRLGGRLLLIRRGRAGRHGVCRIVGEGSGDLGVDFPGFFWGEWGRRGEAFANGGRKRERLACLAFAAEGGVSERHALWRRTAAGAGFVVDDFGEGAVLEEDVLAGLEEVGGLTEGIGDLEGRGFLAAAFDAGIAAGGHSDGEIERSGLIAGIRGDEAQVGGEEDVIGRNGHTELQGSSVERDQEWSLLADQLLDAGTTSQVRDTGLADEEFAAAKEADVGGTIERRDCARAAEEILPAGDGEHASGGGLR